MKLRNKKTGEIVEYDNIFFYKLTCKGNEKFKPNAQTISELNEDWEDYKEPEKYWYLDFDGVILSGFNENTYEFDDDCKAIGNYFSSKEEAEKAVEKLKAWKRLKNKGFKFTGWKIPEEPQTAHIKLVLDAEMNAPDSPYDLDLLFGGED